ncbi:MAG: GAF domain-containing protein [Armatimonadetes bacterium]|nr:GAF domain-containing protein [Armatimonadota bacterium]
MPDGIALALLSAFACAALFGRFRDLVGPGHRTKAENLIVTPSETATVARLSERSGERPRSAPVDPEALEFFRREARTLKESQGTPAFEEILQNSLEAVCNAIGAERAYLFLVHVGAKELISYRAVGAGADTMILLPTDRGIAGEVFRFGSSLVVNDLPENAGYAADLEERIGCQALNILAAPLKDPLGKTLGVFQALNKPGGFSASDQALILPYISSLADALYASLHPAPSSGA